MKDLAVLVADKNMEAAFREIRHLRSSALYADLAAKVSLHRHSEPAFVALTKALRTWFPAAAG